MTGRAQSSQILGVFPSISTPEDVQALKSTEDVQALNITGQTTSNSVKLLNKRGTVAMYGFFCSRNDNTLSPFQDCMNLIGVYCQTTSPLFRGWTDCHIKVEAVRDQLNTNWKNWINKCAKWLGGNPSSAACTDATSTLLNNEMYYWYDENKVLKTSKVPQSVTNAVKYIWST